jgi:hypothetical protein
LLFAMIRFAICQLLYAAMPDKPRRDWTMDDVRAVLAERAKTRGETLNWKLSIVDLCRLLELNPSLESRRGLYELEGGEGEYTGTAQQNIWLHVAVMERLVKEGFGDE